MQNIVNSSLVNGSLGIVQSFETPAQVNQYAVQAAEGQQNEKKKETTEQLQPYPVVLFSNGQKMLCAPTSFQVLNGKGEVEATREQVCAILRHLPPKNKLLMATYMIRCL